MWEAGMVTQVGQLTEDAHLLFLSGGRQWVLALGSLGAGNLVSIKILENGG